ncbi:MAG: hypothetical protein U1D99_07095, partial [Candidatus Omnitrophota bacterium]|nr:hypothetical protein [Candidatus Omnitrophota bacterium]
VPGAAEDQPFVYDDKGKQDPFLRLVSAGGAIINLEGDLEITDMVLEGIIAGEGPNNNIAIINGVILKPNDRIGVFMVRQIREDTVVLEKGQEKFVLKLKRGE